MSYDTSWPKLWFGAASSTGITDQSVRSQECVCDCACPYPLDVGQLRAFVRQAGGVTRDIRLSEDLYLARIEGYTVALSATGVLAVVWDTQVDHLLSYLEDTSSVGALRQAVEWPEEVFKQVITLLLATGVLSSPQAERSNAPQKGPTTLTAWLHLTDQCNLSCRYCYVPRNGCRMDETTVQRAVDAVFRSALAHGCSRVKLKYAGGEPTLNFEALQAAQQRAEILSEETGIALETVVLTNGVHLDDGQIDMLLIHNIRVMVSLDGIGQYQDAQRPLAARKGSSFRCVSRTLDRLLGRGIFPHISVTITRQNIKGLPDLVEHLLEQGLGFSFNFYREPDGSPNHRDLSFTSEEIVAGLRSAFQVIENRLPRYSLLSSLSDRADLRMPHLYTCGVGRNYVVIDCEGRVAKCQMDMAHSVATVDADDPLALVQADTEGIQNLSVDDKDCQECIWRYRCTGGCPFLTFQRTGRYNAKSPLCEVYRAILPEVVRLEALRLVRYEEPWDFGPCGGLGLEELFPLSNSATM